MDIPGFDSVEQFIGYCDIHCETDRALFHRDHIEALHKLAGEPVPAFRGDWAAMHEDYVYPLVEKARKALE